MSDRSDVIDLAYRRKRQQETNDLAVAYQKCVWAERLQIKIPSKRIPHLGKIR